ncbi:hypothetical protein IQ241_20135 [Romeria aff. gracilis LEGE 07310]|uniref:DUF697 domain-containing protein n=1 Tax=Vasconcelosia minhoensis LEGE 07310 TaxID=915328 RepID=A0A8J7A982_9CYAN|nr:EcsC family protein [Romeria gracilis]MBE9079577.1 hypothetical protein [Romeria aff. gracilis LEGE 07310]
MSIQKAPLPSFEEALATADQVSNVIRTFGIQIFKNTASAAVGHATKAGKVVNDSAHDVLSQTTETVGRTIDPIAKNPAVDYIAKVPGLSWLINALGKVDTNKARTEVEALRAKHPLEAPDQLAHRLVVDSTVRAGGIGLATNIIPPVALGLFAVDIAAVSKIQAEMLYRIAAAYGFDVNDPARNGEALTIFGLSLGTSGALKTGLSAVELLPIVGAVVGASSNAGIIYTLGVGACRFYETKLEKLNA